MEYIEYKDILDQALLDYINSGGSIYYITNTVREYIFSYENENLPDDNKKNLSDKAVQMILKRKALPKGIRLEKCILHRKDL